MSRKDKKRQKDLRRRLRQRSGADVRRSREELVAELGDPARFTQCLQVFGQLALLTEALYTCRYPAQPFIQAVLDAELPEGLEGADRVRELRRTIIPDFATADVLDTCQDAIQQAMEQATQRDALLAMTAAGVLISSCREDDLRQDHPFWDLLFEVSLTEAILSGHFLIRLVLVENQVDQAAVGRTFAKELAQGDLSRELDALGAAGADATQLSAACAASATDENPYHLQFDAVLHLARAHVHLAETLGRQIATLGLTSEVRQQALQVYEAAYAADVSETLTGELGQWFRARLEALRDHPAQLEPGLPRGVDHERERCLATYLGLRALPPEESALMRAIHVQSLERARTLAPELERGFVAKLWSQPEDTFALEEYERFLLERQEINRSRRVRTYLELVRRERKATKVEEGSE